MYTRKYKFATITCYPELKSYLEKALQALGEVEVMGHRCLPEPWYEVHIVFRDEPKIFDWRKSNPGGALYINSDAGGCFIRPSIVTCRQLPMRGSKEAGFDFDLSIDSREYPVEQHNDGLVRQAIDTFVQRCKVGFCYHFRS